MQCERARDMLGPYLDEELTGSDRQAVRHHLETCAACARLADDARRLSRQLAGLREEAPAALQQQIAGALAQEAAFAHDGRPAGQPAVRPTGLAKVALLRTGWARQAAVIGAACVLSSALTFAVMTGVGDAARRDSEIVSAHIRSLLQETPVQVASSDQHTVKPWFAGRVDFAPDVKDLTAEGFPLAGGRLDYVGDRRVGALVYRRRLHVINVFMWPAADATAIAPESARLKGYNVVSWSRNGVKYWAVSDLNMGELRQLQSLM